MRRALGLSDDGQIRERPGERPGERQVPQRREPDRRARRFVKDGEVPVVLLNGSREHGAREHGVDAPAPTNRLAVAEAALEAERASRERAERSLHEAQATILHLQTQIAHTNLSHREALAAEREARQAAEQGREAAEQARDAAEQAQAEAVAAKEAIEARSRDTRAAAAPKPARGVRTPRLHPAEDAEASEPQPVKWWLPSYKAKARKRS